MGLGSSRSALDGRHSDGREPERPEQSSHTSCCCAPPICVSKNSSKALQTDSTAAALASPTKDEEGFSKPSMSEASDSSTSEKSIFSSGLVENDLVVHSLVGSSSSSREVQCDSSQQIKQEVRGVSELRERSTHLPEVGFAGTQHVSLDPLTRFGLPDTESLHPASEAQFGRHHIEEMHVRLRWYAGLLPLPADEEPERNSASIDNMPRVRRRRLENMMQTSTDALGRSNFAENDTRDVYDFFQPHQLALPAEVNGERTMSEHQHSALSEEVTSQSVGSSQSLQSIASGLLFSSGPAGGISRGEVSGREARRNSGRRLWDALTRAASHRHVRNHRGFIEDEESELLWHNRTEMSNMRIEARGGTHSEREGHYYYRDRNLNLEDRRCRFRSQVWALQRLNTSFEGVLGHSRFCAPGVRHQSIRHSHESTRPPEEANTRASISRIIMLAEALFQVLDEIHRQSTVLSRLAGLSLSSLPAPDAVVESMPVRVHRRADIAETVEEDALQCYICLVEYEEGDQVRILPCQHEYHTTCIDKWLREVHRVCPLCRGDVCEFRTAGNSA